MIHQDNYEMGHQSRELNVHGQNLQNSNVMNDISMYENSYNSRVVYSRKLYSMLLIQMVVIGLVTALVYSQDQFAQILREYQVIFWVSLVLSIGVATIVLIFRPSCRRAPINWMVYITFTITSALVCAYLVAITDSLKGLLVFTSLASVICFLFFYSLTVKKRLTYQGSTLFLSASLLIVFEMFTIFTNISLFWLIIVSLGSFLFAYFLIYDTQTIVKQQLLLYKSPFSSGEQYDVTIEDYISSSVVVYWDVILLFLRNAEMIKDYMIRERN